MAERGLTADQIDTSVAHPARMYDYYLGGRDNYEVDREAAKRIIRVLPSIQDGARANRGFLHRAVRTLVAEHGVRQILDIGTGIPTSPNTHEIAQAVAPQARVVYVDNDPIVAVHAQARLTGVGNTAFILSDARRLDELLRHLRANQLIDFDQPVAVLLVALLHFVSDADDPAALVAQLRAEMPAGSYLVVSHATRDREKVEHFEQLAELIDVYRHATAALTLRTREQVLGFFDGFELLDPGLVSVSSWRREPESTEPPWIGIYGGIGRKL
ncbi:SAM-dependent methyltransferase [Actinocrinis puniceicyclus]|uniref:SAM-dependent methyltransferase n=1 Tax=Actinocrinis puniceicyclus TaxID=977794 RepID=A0A8J7WQK9_9ACTN|nr:SAM-dependent methyltransferase [Actinocrinis puniceicyclus]MBS2966701.1 SAM-dependent methyltransferase [Actinocrinis puniceicyclus]